MACDETPDVAFVLSGGAALGVSLLTHRRLADDIVRHRRDAELIVLPPPCPLSITPIEFGRAGELIDRALKDARAYLAGCAHDVRLGSPASLTRQ